MFTNLFKPKSTEPQVKILAPISSQAAAYLPPTFFKKLKWVVVGDRAGIITDLSEYNFMSIDFVDAAGITISSAKVPVNQVRIANWEDIPESRRPADPNYASLLGYYPKGA